MSRSLDTRPSINHSHVTQIAVDLADHQWSDAHGPRVSHAFEGMRHDPSDVAAPNGALMTPDRLGLAAVHVSSSRTRITAETFAKAYR